MYTQAAARSRYAGDAVSTASPARLLTMLYDRLARDLYQGEQAQRGGDRETANEMLLHAQDIVMELRSTLHVDAWQGAAGLSALYTFLISELMAANVAMDADRTASCAALVEPLRQAWHEAAAQTAGVAPVATVAASA
ncbi:MAG: flagellar export chaperone FliS [Actinomycetota bacterium]|nr:flagellar export chaperone FliS [Actinomycetota bacterium]